MPRKAMAKIGDPCPLVVGHVKYQSHANYVEAIDVPSGKLLWHTVLYPDIKPKQPDPKLEQDVQLNIISDIKVVGDEIEAQDRRGRIYRLDRKTGKTFAAFGKDFSLTENASVQIGSLTVTLGRINHPTSNVPGNRDSYPLELRSDHHTTSIIYDPFNDTAQVDQWLLTRVKADKDSLTLKIIPLEESR